MRETTGAGETSEWSTIVTYYCANTPAQSNPPYLHSQTALANQNIVVVHWDPPDNRGLQVTKYDLYMSGPDVAGLNEERVCCDNDDSVPTEFITITD